MIFRSVIYGIGAALVASSAFAQDSQCETRGTNGMVTAVLCPPGLDQAAWQQAGVAACDGRKPCGAWIWESEADIPQDVPDSHDKLKPEQITSAVAIWVNENDQLITMEKAN
jgi:hypothetical protein